MDSLDSRWNIKLWNRDYKKLTGFLLNIVETEFTVADELYGGAYFYFLMYRTKRVIRVPVRYDYYVLVDFGNMYTRTPLPAGAEFIVCSALEYELKKELRNVRVRSVEKIKVEGADYIYPQGKEAYLSTKFMHVSVPTSIEFNQLRSILRKIINSNLLYANKLKRFQLQDGSALDSYVSSEFENSPLRMIIKLYEMDIDRTTLALISKEIRTCKWYDIENYGAQEDLENISLANDNKYSQVDLYFPQITENLKLTTYVPELEVLAWDIETHKDPFKFPSAEKDPIMSIAYKTNTAVFLLTNRKFFSTDVREFCFDGKYDCSVFNFEDEKPMLQFFLDHVRTHCQPQIIASYNGDVFDFPYLATRCSINDLSLRKEWGFTEVNPLGPIAQKSRNSCYYLSPFLIHIDCLKWVDRDSYLPCGSRGLKTVARIKLGVQAREVHPELMVEFCRRKPQLMAEYNVSDAIVTFELYMKYIHSYISALSTIIALNVDDVLRKGSGTLCETLLVAQAYRRGILIPNKNESFQEKWYDNERMLLDETYQGGKVEQMRSGIYRADVPEKFVIDENVIHKLINGLDMSYEAFIKEEVRPVGKLVNSNWNDVKSEITQRLNVLKAARSLEIEPLIYHMDVGAMYPNIILTQRLQPYAIVNDNICGNCVFSNNQADCRRKLSWIRRCDILNLDKNAINNIQDSLDIETFDASVFPALAATNSNAPEKVRYHNLSARDRYDIKMQRLKSVSSKLNKSRAKTTVQEILEDSVCQRSNNFYVETVRDFRDRRLIYKGLKKKYEGLLRKATPEQVNELESVVTLYDSLQLAHKCILNSFYGYVMRKGARWGSIQMAAIVTHMGSRIITLAKEICMGIGIPLEMDTDGIWTLLPRTFPTTFEIKLEMLQPASSDNIEALHNPETIKKTYRFEYACWMLNGFMDEKFCNNQYGTFNSGKFEKSTVNSIYFELDGPYKAMFIPASEKQNKELKKRYAVYDFKNRIVELKGFEVKRRGELEMIKEFQENIFPKFILGTTREEIYKEAASVAEIWLRFLRTKGAKAQDERTIIRLLTEGKTLSKAVSDNPNLRTTSATAAKRLCQLRNDSTYVNETGISTMFVISKLPLGTQKTERSIPSIVFESSPEERFKWLSEWCSTGSTATLSSFRADEKKDEDHLSVQEILDWDYYISRLTTQIHKIIIVPCMLQNCPNPCSIPPPPWLSELERHQSTAIQLDAFLTAKPTIAAQPVTQVVEVDDLHSTLNSKIRLVMTKQTGDVFARTLYPSFRDCFSYTPEALQNFISSTDFHILGTDSMGSAIVFNPRFASTFAVPIIRKITIITTGNLNISIFKECVLDDPDGYFYHTFDNIRIDGTLKVCDKIMVDAANLKFESLMQKHYLTKNGDTPAKAYFLHSPLPVHATLVPLAKHPNGIQRFDMIPSTLQTSYIRSTHKFRIRVISDYFIVSGNTQVLLSATLDNILDLRTISVFCYTFGNYSHRLAQICDDYAQLLRATYAPGSAGNVLLHVQTNSECRFQSSSLPLFIAGEYNKIMRKLNASIAGAITLVNIFCNTPSLIKLVISALNKSTSQNVNIRPHIAVSLFTYSYTSSSIISLSSTKELLEALSTSVSPLSAAALRAEPQILNKINLVSFLRRTHITDLIASFKQRFGYYSNNIELADNDHPQLLLTHLKNPDPPSIQCLSAIAARKSATDPRFFGGLNDDGNVATDYCKPGIYRTQILKFTFIDHIYVIAIMLFDQLYDGYGGSANVITQIRILSDTISTTENSYPNSKNKAGSDSSYLSENHQYTSGFLKYLAQLTDCTNSTLILREILFDPTNTDILEEIRYVLLPKLLNKLRKIIEQASQEIGSTLDLIYISNSSILIALPTYDPQVAEKAAPHVYNVLTKYLHRTDVFKTEADHIRCGILFDTLNRILFDTNLNIFDVNLPMLNCIEEAPVIEHVIMYYLTGVYGSDLLVLDNPARIELAKPLTISALQGSNVQSAITSFVVDRFINRIQQKLKIIGRKYTASHTSLVFPGKTAEEIPIKVITWLLNADGFTIYDFPELTKSYHLVECLTDVNDFKYAPIIVLKNLICDSCHRISDLYVSETEKECAYCDSEFSSVYLESYLITLIGLYVTNAHAYSSPKCDKCHRNRKFECQHSCTCGGSFVMPQSSNLRLYVETVKSIAQVSGWELVIDFISSIFSSL